MEALDHLIKLGQYIFNEPDKSTKGPSFKLQKLIVAIRNILDDCGLGKDSKMIEDFIGQTYAYASFNYIHHELIVALAHFSMV